MRRVESVLLAFCLACTLAGVVACYRDPIQEPATPAMDPGVDHALAWQFQEDVARVHSCR